MASCASYRYVARLLEEYTSLTTLKHYLIKYCRKTLTPAIVFPPVLPYLRTLGRHNHHGPVQQIHLTWF